MTLKSFDLTSYKVNDSCILSPRTIEDLEIKTRDNKWQTLKNKELEVEYVVPLRKALPEDGWVRINEFDYDNTKTAYVFVIIVPEELASKGYRIQIATSNENIMELTEHFSTYFVNRFPAIGTVYCSCKMPEQTITGFTTQILVCKKCGKEIK